MANVTRLETHQRSEPSAERDRPAAPICATEKKNDFTVPGLGTKRAETEVRRDNQQNTLGRFYPRGEQARPM